MQNTLKSIGAVLVGFAVVAVLSVATDAVLEKAGIVFPSSEGGAVWTLVLALFYRSAYSVLGGYVTARLAPQNMMKHVYLLMGLGFLGGVGGAFGGWSLGNHWYPVAIAVTGPLFVWMGGKVYCKYHANEISS